MNVHTVLVFRVSCPPLLRSGDLSWFYPERGIKGDWMHCDCGTELSGSDHLGCTNRLDITIHDIWDSLGFGP